MTLLRVRYDDANRSRGGPRCQCAAPSQKYLSDGLNPTVSPSKFFTFDFKGKFPRFGIRSVSTAIDINRSNFDIRWLGRGERMVDLTITARNLVISESSLSEPCPSIVPQGFKGVFKRHTSKRAQVFTGPAMSDTADTANVIVRPPIAWALAALVGLTLQWVVSLPFMPASVPAGWIGGIVFVLALALFAWAIATMTRAGSNVPTNLPTTTIVETGPYRFTRNPIYLGMFLGLVGLAIAFDSLWLLVMLVPFTLAIRYGVVAREEAYLERKFGDAYRQYRARVRRWV